MATNAAQHNHPPLARDANDNYIAIPDGTCAWRICRKTDGRPREIFGPDKQPMRFPLDTTLEDLADTCGPDTYRLYALDEVGRTLGPCVATVSAPREVRDLRNGATPEFSSLLSLPRASVPAPTSDLRYALEAMTQMMRINGEALRAVAESQADWVKSIASVKGYFRNATPPQRQLSESTSRDDEEDDDDEDDGDDDPDPPPPKGLYDVLTPFAEHLAPQVGPLVAMLAGGGATSASSGRPALASAGEERANVDSDLASKPKWELRDLVDFKYAGDKAKAKKAARAGNASTASGHAKPSLQARVMQDRTLMAHFIAIKSLLAPDELQEVMALADQSSEAEQEHLIAQIAPLTPAKAAALLREMLQQLRAARVPADETPT